MTAQSNFLRDHGKLISGIGATVILVAVAAATYPYWLPTLQASLAQASDSEHDDHDHGHDDHDDHEGHDHGDHEGHDHSGDSESLELSEVAWKNIGLRTGIVELSTFAKTVAVPAMVTERPGRSQVEITAPLTGIVTRVHTIEGEAIQPGQPLFDLRLTHEDLVTAQRDYLQSAQELDVVIRELKRLQDVGDDVIMGRRVLEQDYQRQKLEAALLAQRQGLLLHGLTDDQITTIYQTRHLIQDLTVNAPQFDDDTEHHEVNHLYHVQSINVKRGQSVAAGETLGVLADHCLLYVEGQAFEEDAQRLVEAARGKWKLTVSPATARLSNQAPMQLEIFYVADQIDEDSRALKFYLMFANTMVRDEVNDGHRFVAWEFRPGQRMQVKIPIGQPWVDQIVLPPGAVVEEGAEAFVFEQNGEHFDRIPVHVVYRDQGAVIVENDGSLIGSTLAMSGAYQMHLALKNQAGGGVDPHAGHNH